MQKPALKILRVVGAVYLAVAFAVIAVGYASILYFDGFWRLWDIIQPTNTINWIVTIAVLAPGIGLLMLAERLERRH